MRLKFLLLTFFISHSLFIQAQTPSYPKSYFRNPLEIPMQLTANFGELRPNHWHMGLDIRTDGKENQLVYAAADGYIAKVGIRPQSFGRFIIINHPNGLSTLYGHLNDFVPELEKYVTEQQYKQESWAVELYLTNNQFPVRKGNFIAYSGNTGGSQGAHLHFEIFDTKTEKRLNPLLFGFPIQDYTPPTIVRLAMYDRSRSVYEQSPMLFSVKKTDSGYIIPKIPVIKTGLNKISFALQMFDKMNAGGSEDGVYSATLYMDDIPQIRFVLDSIDYVETGYINAHIDYKFDYKGGVYLQHLSQLPGHKGVEYKKINGDAVLQLADTAVHNISIDVKDAYGNRSQLNFAIQNIQSLAWLIPQRNMSVKLAPNKDIVLEKPGFKMYLSKTNLYDSVPFLFSVPARSGFNAVSEMYMVNDASIPVYSLLAVKLKPNTRIAEEARNKIVILRTDNKENQVKKAEWQGEWLTAKFGNFGSYQAFTDLIPPSVNELGKGDTINLSSVSRIVFTPADNFSVKNFRAELDSQWIRFTNDKSRNWIYKFDERCPFGVHHLKVRIEDLVGNVTEKKWWFKRFPYTAPPKEKKIVKKGSSTKKPVNVKKQPSKSH
jgi:hypothetical protein